MRAMLVLRFLAATAVAMPAEPGDKWKAQAVAPDGSFGMALLARKHSVGSQADVAAERSFEEGSLISLRTDATGNTKIPLNILFNHRRALWIPEVGGLVPLNLLNLSTKDIAHDEHTKLLQQNVFHTISSFKGHGDAQVLFWDDEQCVEGLRSLSAFGGEELSEDFVSEHVGMVKSDLCRLAMLYKFGGYYFDTDILPVVPMREHLGKDTTFATIVAGGGEAFFQAFMAATPQHPVVAAAIDRFKNWYEQIRQPGYGAQSRFSMAGGNVGTVVLKQAYDDWARNDAHDVPKGQVSHIDGHVSRFFVEDAIADLRSRYSGLVQGTSAGYCNFAVVDPTSETLLMYSRIYDSRKHTKCSEEVKLLQDLQTNT